MIYLFFSLNNNNRVLAKKGLSTTCKWLTNVRLTTLVQ